MSRKAVAVRIGGRSPLLGRKTDAARKGVRTPLKSRKAVTG